MHIVPYLLENLSLAHGARTRQFGRAEDTFWVLLKPLLCVLHTRAQGGTVRLSYGKRSPNAVPYATGTGRCPSSHSSLTMPTSDSHLMSAEIHPARNRQGPSDDLKTARVIAYAAPAAGSYFFYISMWSVLPGIYGKYFGLPLTSIAAVVLVIRLFDGLIDTTTGYLSDWHRCAGGSRKPWVVIGGMGSIVACYFLFTPSIPATTTYYLTWSVAYFLAFTIAEIPHLTWGSELTMNYQQRANVFGVRNMLTRFGITAFYALPLLPFSSSTDYTPQFLHHAIYVGAVMTLVGLVQAIAAAPAGVPVRSIHHDTIRLLTHSLIHNKPLLIYFASFICVGLCVGMWSGLVFFYVDGYLGLGDKLSIMFLVGSAVGGLATPLWLNVIHRTSKPTVWAIGIVTFISQLLVSFFLTPGCSWWIPFGCVVLAHVFFCCHDVAALSLLGDIVDYGKLKFRRDRGATYFGFNTLLFKVGLGLGGGLGLAGAGLFGFDPTRATHSPTAVFGLKLGFTILPACFALLGLFIILRTPINRRRHEIIRRRLESRASRAPQPLSEMFSATSSRREAHVGT